MHRLPADRCKETTQQRGRRRPVHVVVAEHRDRLAAQHGLREPRGERIHAVEHRGIGQPVAQPRREMPLKLLGRDAAQRDQSRDGLGQPVRLGQQRGLARIGGADDPAPAAERPHDRGERGQTAIHDLRVKLWCASM